MSLGDSDGLVENRDKKSQKHEDDAFARMLAGKLALAAHPFRVFKRSNTTRSHPLPTWPSLHANLVSRKHDVDV